MLLPADVTLCNSSACQGLLAAYIYLRQKGSWLWPYECPDHSCGETCSSAKAPVTTQFQGLPWESREAMRSVDVATKRKREKSATGVGVACTQCGVHPIAVPRGRKCFTKNGFLCLPPLRNQQELIRCLISLWCLSQRVFRSSGASNCRCDRAGGQATSSTALLSQLTEFLPLYMVLVYFCSTAYPTEVRSNTYHQTRGQPFRYTHGTYHQQQS
jgi:hypothetical protein